MKFHVKGSGGHWKIPCQLYNSKNIIFKIFIQLQATSRVFVVKGFIYAVDIRLERMPEET